MYPLSLQSVNKVGDTLLCKNGTVWLLPNVIFNVIFISAKSVEFQYNYTSKCERPHLLYCSGKKYAFLTAAYVFINDGSGCGCECVGRGGKFVGVTCVYAYPIGIDTQPHPHIDTILKHPHTHANIQHPLILPTISKHLHIIQYLGTFCLFIFHADFVKI